MAVAMDSVAELEEKLGGYRAQLDEIQAALNTDPDEETKQAFQKLKQDIKDLISITEDLLRTAKASEGGASSSGAAEKPFRPQMGSKVLAMHKNTWAPAVVTHIEPDGRFVVNFTDTGVMHTIPLASLRSPDTPLTEADTKLAGKKRAEGQQGGKEQKKKKDDKKKDKAPDETKVRAQEWQKFVNKGPGKAPKGYLTGLSLKKKESMFKSPDSVDGKVGVTGSGRGMTEFTTMGRMRMNE
eukprot:tig00020592_g11685.t1